jgi:inner membrane protein
MPVRFWVAACAVSVLPDADAILHNLGVPYSHPLGHRGFWHSLTFAAVVAGVVTVWLLRERRWWVFLFLFVVGASHGVLDAMTDGGLGVAFFAPFENTRYFLPWRPLVVGPIGIVPFFSAWGVEVMISEILHVWLPLAGLLLVAEVTRKSRSRHAGNKPA